MNQQPLARAWPAVHAAVATIVCILAVLGTFRGMDSFPLIFGALWILGGLVSLWRTRGGERSRAAVALLVAGLVLSVAVPLAHRMAGQVIDREVERNALAELAGEPAPRPAYGELLNAPDGGLGELDEGLVLINAWATWCPPCLEELPLLDAFAEEFRDDGVQVIGLAWTGEPPSEEEVSTARSTLAEIGVDYPVALGATPTNKERFLIDRLPTTILVEDGQIVDYRIGLERTEALLERLARRLR